MLKFLGTDSCSLPPQSQGPAFFRRVSLRDVVLLFCSVFWMLAWHFLVQKSCKKTMKMQQLLPEGAASGCCWQVYWGGAAAFAVSQKMCRNLYSRNAIFGRYTKDQRRDSRGKMKKMNRIFWIFQRAFWLSPLKCCAIEMFIPQERFRQLKEVGIFQFDCLKRILASLHTEGLWAWHGSAEEGLAKLKVQEEWHTSGQHCAQIQFQNEVKPQFGTQQGAQAHHSHRTTLRLPGVRCRCRFRGFLDRWLDCRLSLSWWVYASWNIIRYLKDLFKLQTQF